MLTPADFLRLPYTPDLTEGGIARAALLAHSFTARVSPYDGCAAWLPVAVELAFRRYLSNKTFHLK